MTAAEWQNRILAVSRAAANGDPGPLGIVCSELAELEANIEQLTTPKKAAAPLPKSTSPTPAVPTADESSKENDSNG